MTDGMVMPNKARVNKMARKSQKQIERYLLKRLNNQGVPREVRPLTSAGRVYQPDGDWDTYIEYGFLSNYKGKPINGNEYTDDEVRDFIEDGYVMRINSPYDCTGKHFTMLFDWHRNPSGLISYRHMIGIDV